MIGNGQTIRVVLYEGAGAAPLGDGERLELLRALLEKGYPLSVVRPGGSVSDVRAGTLLVLGRFENGPPAVDVEAPGDVKVHFAQLEGAVTRGAAAVALVEAALGEAAKRASWKPWFPVIDYQRCTNCMQCLSFCLFDVYGVSPEGKIRVQNESNCKTDCPACSRVCPEVAILFPKYRFGPINGEEVNPEDVRREAMKVDISALLGGDIYAALRDRSERARSRFSRERDEERALAERQRCLAKLQKTIEALEVPAEVLASLPSADEIRARAQQARARAEAALGGGGSQA